MTTQDKIQEAMTYLERAKEILEEGYRDVSSEEVTRGPLNEVR